MNKNGQFPVVFENFETMHSKKYLGDFPKVTKQKVPISLSLHPFSVSSGNFLVAFGGSR